MKWYGETYRAIGYTIRVWGNRSAEWLQNDPVKLREAFEDLARERELID